MTHEAPSTASSSVVGMTADHGGDMVVLPILGTVMRPTSGDYCKFTVLNGQASYVLP